MICKAFYLFVIIRSTSGFEDLAEMALICVLESLVSSDSNCSRQVLTCEWMTAIWEGLNFTDMNSWRASSELTVPKFHTSISFSILYVPAEVKILVHCQVRKPLQVIEVNALSARIASRQPCSIGSRIDRLLNFSFGLRWSDEVIEHEVPNRAYSVFNVTERVNKNKDLPTENKTYTAKFVLSRVWFENDTARF